VSGPPERPGDVRRRHVFALCGELGLSRDDRIELANEVLHRSIDDEDAIHSFSQLTNEEVALVQAALEGFFVVGWLRVQGPENREPWTRTRQRFEADG
jgi:hypothetical protein